MKKLLVLMMCIVCVLSMTVTTYAETNQTVISLTIAEDMESYTVFIPPTCDIDPATKSETIEVTLKDVNLVWSSGITVYAVPTNRDSENGGAFLVNTADSTKKIHYNLKDFNEYVYDGTDMLTAARYHNGKAEENYIELTIDGDYPGAGTYTDTLTFTVELY